MQQNRERENSGTINERSNNSCDQKSTFNHPSDSSDEFFGPRITEQFRRWANNVWNLSSNVTNRLKELLNDNPRSDVTTSNFAAENGSPDKRNQPSNGSFGWITSSNLTESSKRIKDDINGKPRCHNRHVSFHNRGNYFGNEAEDSRMPKIISNRVGTGPFIVAHGVATFPPVLVLPRINQGQPMHAEFHHSKEGSIRCQNIHGDEYADEWYQKRYHRSGIKEWEGYKEAPRRDGQDYSSLLEPRGISEKLNCLDDESESRDPEEKVKSSDYKPAKKFFDQTHCSSDIENHGSGWRSKNLSTFIESNNDNKEGVNLTVATCIAGNNLPPSFENKNNGTDGYSVELNQGFRVSFSDRIQDIWRNSGSRVQSGSPVRYETRISFDNLNLNSGKDVSSKLSLLGLDRQPALREYFSEYNSAVTLARILENLIDAKSRSDNSPASIPEMKNRKPKFASNRSKTGLVDVGVQNSMPTSTTACQNSTTNSRHVLLKEHVSRESFVKTCKHRAPGILVETPRPLEAFFGQSTIPISPIELTPIIQQPCRDVNRFATQSLDARGLSTSYESYGNSSVRKRDSGFSAQLRSLFPLNCRDISQPSSISPHQDPVSFSKRSSFAVENRRTILPDNFYSNRNSDTLAKNRNSIDKREEIFSTVVNDRIEGEKQSGQFSTPENSKSSQRIHDSSLPIRFRATNRVAEISSDDVSSKSRSWWQKKFHFGRSSIFKGRITSLLRKVMKKYAGSYYHCEKNDAEMSVRKDVVPTPPIRNKRECPGVNRKFSKSIQWDFDATLLFSDQRIESFRAPVVNEVTVQTTGTNTTAIKSFETSSEIGSNKLTKQTKASMIKTAQIKPSRNKARVDSLDKGQILDRIASKSNGVVHVTEKLKLPESNKKESDDDGSLPSRENFFTKDGRESSGLKTFRSLSSRLPLATGSVSPFNSTRVNFGSRSSTAPMPNNRSVYSSRSKVLPEDIEAGKSTDKDSSSQGSKTKVLFKHNRSSLLRANNSTLKKSAIRAFNLSRKTTREKDVEILSISKSLTSSDTINEKEFTRLLPVEENRSEKLVSEFERFEENKYDGKTEELPSKADAETKDISKPSSSTPLSSEQKAKQSIAGEKSCLDINGILSPRVKDTTRTNKKIRNNSASSYDSQPIGPNHVEASKENKICFTKEKLRSPKRKIIPLNLEACYSYGVKEKKATAKNLSRKKLSDYEKMKFDSVSLKGKKFSCNYVAAKEREKIQTNLRSKKLFYDYGKMRSNSISLKKSKAYCHEENKTEARDDETRLQEEDKLGSIKVIESKRSLNKLLPSDPDSAEIQPSNDEKSIPNVKLVYSTVSKTAEHFFKQVDLPVKKKTTVSSIKETDLSDRPRRDFLASKFDKNVAHSQKLFRKSFVSPDLAIPKSNSAKLEADVSFPASPPRKACDSRRPVVRAPSGFEKSDSTSVSKTARAASNRCKTGNKNEPGLIKDRKMRNENTEEMVEAVRRMLDAVISELINTNRKTKSEIVSLERNISESSSFNDEKTTVPSGEIFLIEETLFSNIRNEMNDSPFILPRVGEEFANSCPQGSLNIHSTLSSQFLSKNMPETVDKDFRVSSSSEKFPVAIKSLEKNEAEEIVVAPLDPIKYTNIKSNFATKRLQRFEHVSYSLFNLTEILDNKAEKLRLSMVNIHVEFSESKRQVNFEEAIGVAKSLNSLSNAEWRNSKYEKFSGNVKIDNKVLEEKVKCSIENGVPLKTIIITDPSIIKKNNRNIEFEKQRPGVDVISKEVLISSLDLSSDVNSEEGCD